MDAGERREFDYITMFRLGMVIVVVSKAQIVVRWNVNDIDEKSLEAVMDFLDSLVTSPKVMIEYYFVAGKDDLFPMRKQLFERWKLPNGYGQLHLFSNPL
jgi:hypothetical protein